MGLTPPWIQARAAQTIFLIILFQVPLFRTQCRTGICTAPLEVMMGQLAAGFPLPASALKGALYPGALMHRLWNSTIENTPFDAPNWDTLLVDYKIDQVINENTTYIPKYRLEVMAGSYFVVGGALQALWKAGRLGLLGLLLIGWGLYKEGLWQAFDSGEDSFEPDLYPIFFVALVLTLLTMNFDAEKVKRLAPVKARPGLRLPKQKVR